MRPDKKYLKMMIESRATIPFLPTTYNVLVFFLTKLSDVSKKS